jgi:enterochelin esterase-like enzyme
MIVRYRFQVGTFCLWFVAAYSHAQTTTENGPPQSPRLASLLTALDRHEPLALDAFWSEVEETHSPLIEEVPNHPHNALYTFLLRADPETDVVNARLSEDFPGHTANYMDSFQRLGASNVWYTSYELPKGSRIVYRIRVPQGLHPSPQSLVSWTIDGIRYEHFLDPLNPRIFPDTHAPLSYCIGPEAAPVPYLDKQAEVPSGSMEKFDVVTNILGGKRAVTMYTPAGYTNSSKPLAFVLVFDAEDYINTVGMPTMLDNMIAQSVVSPVVVAFLHTPDTRNEDLLPNAKFQAFVASELMPWIRKKYRIGNNPKLNVVAGSSFGGLAAAYTAFSHPEIFGNVLSQSGSFWWSPTYLTDPVPSPNAGWIVKQMAESPSRPIRFYITAGTWESPGMLSANRIMRSVLLGKGNRVDYTEVANGHNYANTQQTLPDGLITLLGHQSHH